MYVTTLHLRSCDITHACMMQLVFAGLTLASGCTVCNYIEYNTFSFDHICFYSYHSSHFIPFLNSTYYIIIITILDIQFPFLRDMTYYCGDLWQAEVNLAYNHSYENLTFLQH